MPKSKSHRTISKVRESKVVPSSRFRTVLGLPPEDNDPEVWTGSYAELVEGNRDDEWLIEETTKLKVGESLEGGGGAAPRFRVTRLS